MVAKIDKITLDTLITLINNATGGGYIAVNAKNSLNGEPISNIQTLANVQSLLNMGVNIINSGLTILKDEADHNKDFIPPSSLDNSSALFSKIGGVVASAGFAIDTFNITSDMIASNRDVKLGDTLSAISNIASVIATVAGLAASGTAFLGLSAGVLATGAAALALAAGAGSIYIIILIQQIRLLQMYKLHKLHGIRQ